MGCGPDEPPVVEDRDVVADALDVVEDVGRVEDRGLALDPLHELEHLAPADGVERADRLVEEQHRGPGDERLGDPQPLAHAAGVGLRPPVRRIGDPDQVEDLLDARASGRASGGYSEPTYSSVSRPVIQP